MSLEEITNEIDAKGDKVEILQTQYLYHGKLELDILYRTKGIRRRRKFFNLEPQNRWISEEELDGRSDLYLSVGMIRQKGFEYKNQNYEQLKDVYSVWLIFGKKRSMIKHKCMGHMHKVYIYIADQYDPDETNEHLRYLTLIADTNLPKNVKIRILEEEFGICDDEKEDIKAMCNVSRNVYENGRVFGNSEGFEKGLTEGLLEGMKNQNKKVVKNMYEAHLPIEMIQIATQLSQDEIYQILLDMNLIS